MLALVRIVSGVVAVYQFLILIRVLLSWVNPNPYSPLVAHPLVSALYRITEPVLGPLRRWIPPVGGTLDISPVVAILILEVLRWVLTAVFTRLA
jgi:YggT family protein